MSMTVEIPVARLNKIIDALSVLALGNVEPERTQIAVSDEDDLALLEHTLNELSAELAALRIESQRSNETIQAQRLVIRSLATPAVELVKLLGLQVQTPAGGCRKELELIVNELLGADPVRSQP